MELDVIDNGTTLFLNEEFIDVPFAGNIDQTFEEVLKILDVNNLSKLKQKVLQNISYVLDLLASVGNTHEGLIFDAAQAYVLLKHTNLSPIVLNDYFSKHAKNVAVLLSQKYETLEEKLKFIFENEEYPYASKVMLADYIYELSINKNDKALLNEINSVVANYENKTQKGLMARLKSQAC